MKIKFEDVANIDPEKFMVRLKLGTDGIKEMLKMDTPYAFSKMLVLDKKTIERFIFEHIRWVSNRKDRMERFAQWELWDDANDCFDISRIDSLLKMRENIEHNPNMKDYFDTKGAI